MDTIGARLRSERERLRLSQAEFAGLAGAKKLSQGRYEAGDRVPDAEYLVKLDAHGVDTHFVLTGQRHAEAIQAIKDEARAEVARQLSALNGISVMPESEPLGIFSEARINAEEYAKVALHEVELDAGTGAMNDGEQISGDLVFKRSWLRRVGVSPANARLARVRGKSMEPTLQDGDVVLIDTSRDIVPARPRDPERPLRADIYALREGEQLRVKRVEHSKQGQLVLHSDNSMMFPPEVREGYDARELGIIGKVVWWGHTER